jgi:hypothetical protein
MDGRAVARGRKGMGRPGVLRVFLYGHIDSRDKAFYGSRETAGKPRKM